MFVMNQEVVFLGVQPYTDYLKIVMLIVIAKTDGTKNLAVM